MTFPMQPPELDAWASGFPVMLLHAVLMPAILFLGAALYGALTPYREIQLIREGNSAAALSLTPFSMTYSKVTRRALERPG